MRGAAASLDVYTRDEGSGRSSHGPPGEWVGVPSQRRSCDTAPPSTPSGPRRLTHTDAVPTDTMCPESHRVWVQRMTGLDPFPRQIRRWVYMWTRLTIGHTVLLAGDHTPYPIHHTPYTIPHPADSEATGPGQPHAMSSRLDSAPSNHANFAGRLGPARHLTVPYH